MIKSVNKAKYIVSGFLLLLSTRVYSVEEVVSPVSKTTAEKSSSLMTEEAFSNPMSSSYLIQLILGLVVVILCVVALAWFAKKMNKFNSAADESLKIISGISIGAREKIVLLQVGDEQILVGVAPGNINKLHDLKEPLIATNSHPIEKGLANKFKQIMDDASALSSNKKNNK